MKTKLLLSFLLFTFAFYLLPCIAQVPQGFNYQAIARDGSGNVIPNQPLPVKIDIVDALTSGNLIYEELFSSVTSNQFGLISLVVGTGAPQSGGKVTSFSAIDWKSKPLYIRTIIEYPGSTWTTMGTSQIMSVPYSLLAKDVQGPVTSIPSLGITGTTDVMDSALFEVRNKAGNLVFAVYNEGVRAYVGNGSKGAKGGFAVGGYDGTKDGSQHDLLYVTSDSVRVYVDSHLSVKGNRGGFSVGGYDMTKGTVQDYLNISKDSARIYVDTNPLTKGVKGGFSVGGYDMTKGSTSIQDLLDISKDSARIYVDSNPATKGVKGGFSVGGYDMTKGGSSISNYLNIETNSTGIINPAENRILWYPLKNAFLTGRVLITNSTNVGQQSFAAGYEPMANGDYSQAMGFQPVAAGTYSTAIGKKAYAGSPNSFSLGDSAQAKANDSYAFGAGAVASGIGSFAFGSVGRDTTTFASTGVYTTASGNYSFAFGQASQASGIGSVSFGLNNISSRDYSISIGYNNLSSGYLANSFGANNVASGWFSTALGFMNTAKGDVSLAIGNSAIAAGVGSIAIGLDNVQFGSWYAPIEADGDRSVAIGHGVTASAYASFVVGQQNEIPGSYSVNSWVDTDPLFVIGNGNGGSSTFKIPIRSNAMVVLKNGNVGFGTSTPTKNLEVAGDALFDGNEINSGYIRVVGYPSPIYSGSANQGLYIGWNKSGNTGEANFINQIGGGSGGFTFDNTNALLYHVRLMTILGSGNVGIGYTDPSYPLSVNGTIDATGYHTTSDIRFKKDVQPITDALNKILELQGVSFNWDKTSASELNFDDQTHFGFIAQDIEKILPQVVSTANDNNQTKSVAYGDVVPVLVEAIKEQQQQIEVLKAELDKLKTSLK